MTKRARLEHWGFDHWKFASDLDIRYSNFSSKYCQMMLSTIRNGFAATLS